MFGLLLIATNSLTAPGMLPTTIDYPTAALRDKRSAAAVVELVVGPSGAPIRCETLRVFEDQALAQDICKEQSRFRFRPATDESGKATYGVRRLLVKYFITDTAQGARVKPLFAPEVTVEIVATQIQRPAGSTNAPTDRQFVALPYVTFEVQALPGIAAPFLDARVVVGLDTGAKVASCEPDTANDLANSHPAYEAAACRELRNTKLSEPLVINGTPVSHVRAIEVRFALRKGA